MHHAWKFYRQYFALGGSLGLVLVLVFVLFACQSTSKSSMSKTTPPTATSTTVGLYGNLAPSPTGSTATTIASPRPTPPVTPPSSGIGMVPNGFPHYFSFGSINVPWAAGQLDEQRTNNGTAYAFRYQYIDGGVNTSSNWTTWNQPTGQFVTYYMQESAQHGYIPTLVYYNICQSTGPQGGTCAGNQYTQDLTNLASPSIMKAFYANWVLFLKEISAFGKPVLVITEPDLWGFIQSASTQDNAASVPASVDSSGYADAAGFPNNAQGFAWALLHMRDLYAHNAILALHASPWGNGNDYNQANSDVAGLAQREANFLNSAGLVGNPAGVSTWDLISNDIADHDSGQAGAGMWWDRYNQTFPNFARYLSFISMLTQKIHRRVVMWQVPMGNQYFDTMDNSTGHTQDNKAEYILGHVSDFAAAGIVGVLFGPGNGGTMNVDVNKDGITNPAPINTYECNACNTHVSTYADDDGGYLRLFIGAYMKNPVSLP